MRPLEELSEKEHCAVGVFSWWVKLVSPSAPHGACSRGSELWSGWHQRLLPLRQPVIAILVAGREDEGHRKYVAKKSKKCKNKWQNISVFILTFNNGTA